MGRRRVLKSVRNNEGRYSFDSPPLQRGGEIQATRRFSYDKLTLMIRIIISERPRAYNTKRVALRR